VPVKYKVTFVLTSLLAFLLDRLTKLWAVSALKGAPLPLIPNFLELRLAENPGAAFSLFAYSHEVLRKLFLLLIPLLIVLAVLYYGLFKGRDYTLSTSLGLVLGGAVGNLYDRFLYGKVIDFIDFHFKNYHYPTFNLADAFVFLGVVVLSFKAFKKS
jgi:signal peptidase II